LNYESIKIEPNKNHKSLGTGKNCERIAALNRRSKKKITLEIIDLKDDEGKARGTLVRFGIKVKIKFRLSLHILY
jgi:hypothetical protein